MGNFIFMGNSTHGVAREYLVAPFNYDEGEPDVIGTGHYPEGVSLDMWVKWWWRLKNMTAELSFDFGGGFAGIGSVNLGRYDYTGTNVLTEEQLYAPGGRVPDDNDVGMPNVFNGRYIDEDWNGVGGYMDLEVTVRLNVNDGIAPSRMYWDDSGDDPVLYPALLFEVEFSVTSPGTEYLFQRCVNAGPGIGDKVGDGSFDGTTAVPLYHITGDVVSATQFGLTISPAAFFDWDGIRSTSTGLVLADRRARELLLS